jgi:hypothetical protein
MLCSYHIHARGKGEPGASQDLRPGDVATNPEHALQRDDDELLCCAACGHAITSASARISVDGKHEHERANPSGFVYRIGCFREAPGCGASGEPTRFFTWFPGFAWRYATCGACGVHLGWSFHGEAGATFHGLVLDRLIERRRN